MCLHKNTLRKEHERRRVAGKTVEETRCARRRLVVVVVFLLSLSSLLLFFVVAKRAKERPLMTLFFSLFFSSSQPTTQKRTSRVISLSLSLFVKSTKVCVDWRVSPAWISPRKLPTPSSNCAARTSRPWRSSPCWKVWPGDGEKSTTPRCRRLCNTKKGRHIRNT